jgi:hypothetical protein
MPTPVGAEKSSARKACGLCGVERFSFADDAQPWALVIQERPDALHASTGGEGLARAEHRHVLVPPDEESALAVGGDERGPAPLTLDSVAVRYWFNCDCAALSALQSFVDWAGLLPSGRNITSSVRLAFETTALGTQTHALVMRFTGGLVLGPGETVEVDARFNKADLTNMHQLNDFSFAPFSSFTTWNRVPVYFNGERMTGLEP